MAFATPAVWGTTMRDAPRMSPMRQDAAAAHEHDRHVARRRFHAIDGVFEHRRACAASAAVTSAAIETADALRHCRSCALPAATAMSVAVSVEPPNTSASLVQPEAHGVGPDGDRTRPSARTRLPPPRPIDSTSGMRKFVRTPPTSTAIELSRGKPSSQHADVGRRAADVDDDAVVEAAEESAAANAVRRAGREREHREALRQRRGGISVPSFWLT